MTPLQQQLNFLYELDQLKHVIRQTILVNGERKENSAEHSWHVAIAAITLADYADHPVNISRVLKMLLVHDIVEIDAGDTFAFDDIGYADKAQREQAAANRIFGLLPTAQAAELRGYWEEFEAMQTPDAQFANAIDGLLPFLHNVWTEGKGSWAEHHPAYDKVFQRNQQRVGQSSAVLWDYVQGMLQKARDDDWGLS